MIVVAGPPGSGKSSRFPLSRFGVDWFNFDDRAAELNLGSFHKIPAEVRSRVNVEFQQWILNHITAREGFAIETTLRSPITFEQARLAHGHGSWTTMDYVSVGSVEESSPNNGTLISWRTLGFGKAGRRHLREEHQKSSYRPRLRRERD